MPWVTTSAAKVEQVEHVCRGPRGTAEHVACVALAAALFAWGAARCRTILGSDSPANMSLVIRALERTGLVGPSPALSSSS